MVGWRLDSRTQLISVYQVTLPSIPCEAVFRVSRPGIDLSGLARRAVAGDQAALDVFSAWRPRTAGRQPSVHQDNMAVYVATAQGRITHFHSHFCVIFLSIIAHIFCLIFSQLKLAAT